VRKILTDKQTAELEGTKLRPEHITTVLEEDADVYCEETGACLLKFRKNVIPANICEAAYESLLGAGRAVSDNRGMAAGPVTDEDILRVVKHEGGSGFIRKDAYRYVIVGKSGRVSKTSRSKRTRGSIVGYFGRTARQPFCRLTAYTQKHFARFKKAFPMVRAVSEGYRLLMPENYRLQMEAVGRSSADFVIPGTAFSTITVNHNFPTALHYDKGDFEKGFGNLTVVRKGKYTGACTAFPQYGVGCDVHTGDLLMMDVHKLHGNTPMVSQDLKAERLAFVMYFREDIMSCGSFKDELRAARKAMEGRLMQD
jgi:hypothetical protein